MTQKKLTFNKVPSVVSNPEPSVVDLVTGNWVRNSGVIYGGMRIGMLCEDMVKLITEFSQWIIVFRSFKNETYGFVDIKRHKNKDIACFSGTYSHIFCKIPIKHGDWVKIKLLNDFSEISGIHLGYNTYYHYNNQLTDKCLIANGTGYGWQDSVYFLI